MRLPAAPILAVLERAVIAQGYIGHGGNEGIPGLEAFVELLGIEPRAIYRAKKSGEISLGMADQLACALNLHPLLIWPAEWEAETLRRRERRAEVQRGVKARRRTAA